MGCTSKAASKSYALADTSSSAELNIYKHIKETVRSSTLLITSHVAKVQLFYRVLPLSLEL